MTIFGQPIIVNFYLNLPVKSVVIILFSFIFFYESITEDCFAQKAADTIGFHTNLIALNNADTQDIDSKLLLLDSMINIYQHFKPSNDLVLAYAIYGKKLIYSRSYKEAIKMLNKGIDVASKIEDTSNLIKLYQTTGIAYLNKANYDSANKYYRKGYDLALKYSNPKLMAVLLSGLGMIKMNFGDFDSSIYYYYKAEKLFQEEKNYIRLSILYNNLGIVYQKINNFKLSLHYYKKGMQTIDSSSYKAILHSILANIGELYFDQELYDSAYIYYMRTLEAIDSSSNPLSYYFQINNIGNYFLETGKYRKAISYYEKVHHSKYFNLNKKLKTAVIINIGNAYYNLGELDSAYILTNLGLKYAKENHILDFEKNGYNILTSIDTLKNDWKIAYYHHLKYQTIKDSLINKKTLFTIDSLHSAMELKKHIVQNELLKRENEANKKEVLIQKIGLLLLILTLLFIIIILAVVKKNKEKITKLYIDLGEKNKIISEQNIILKQTNKELEQLNKMKTKFFSIVGHDLKSPFNSILGFLDILNSQYEDISIREEEKQKIVQLLLNATEEAYSLLQNLLNWALVQEGKIIVKKQPVKLLSVIGNSINLYHLSSKQKNITIEKDIEQNLLLNTDKQLLNNIFNNLLSNAIKFSHNGGVIRLFTERSDQYIKICISDNGTGIPEDKIANLFYVGSTYKQKGTNNESGTGLGLTLCNEYATLLGGTIEVKSKLGVGSCFCLVLPKDVITDVSK